MTSFFTWQGRGRNVPVLLCVAKRQFDKMLKKQKQ